MSTPADSAGLMAPPQGMGVLVAVSALLVLGGVWGLSMPLTKIATSTGHGVFGLIFWQLIFVALALSLVQLVRWRRPMVRPRHLFLLLVIAYVGTLIPNSITYISIRNLPAGVYSIVLSLVPMSAFAIAALMGNEPFASRRLWGLLLGLTAVLLIIGPEASLPAPGLWVFVLLGAGATVCYGFEGNFIARFGLGGLGPVEVLLFSSVVGAVFAMPLAVATGQFIDLTAPWKSAEWALLGLSVMHAMAYVGYIWLVGRAGAVFAAQISYPVTLFGVLGSMLVLGETYSGWIWLALVIMLAGLFLVQPRQKSESGTDAG